MVTIKSNRHRHPAPAFLENFFVKDFLPNFDFDFRNPVAAANVLETEKSYTVQISGPGFQKEDFAVKVENNVLSIEAKKSVSKESETEKYLRKEFVSRDFKRSFTLPENVDGEKIKASYENGILSVELPKKEVADNNATKTIVIS